MTPLGAALAEVPCRLPGGLLIDGRWVRDAAVRPLNGRDEEWLAGWERSVPSAFVQTALLERCVTRVGVAKPDAELIKRMLVGDRDYLLLRLRGACLGPTFDAVTECPECHSRIDLTFGADEIPVEERPQRAVSLVADVERANGSKVTVRYHLPAGRDQEAAALASEADRRAELITSCLEAVDAVDDPGEAGRLLDATASTQLEETMARDAPQVTADMDFVCPVCGHATSRDFELVPFLLDELGAGAQRILHEVHTLAYNYHWTEAEILDMPRSRRHAYLGLLQAEASLPGEA